MVDRMDMTDRVAAAAGGAAAWGGITGTLASQLDLLAALNGKEAVNVAAGLMAAHVADADPHTQYLTAAEGVAVFAGVGHTHGAFTAVAAGFAPASGGGTANFLRADGSWAAPAGGGGVLAGTATITMVLDPFNDTEVVAAVGVVPGNRVFLSLGEHADADENDPELLDLSSLSGVAGTNQITVKAVFLTPTAGPVKLNWMVA